MCEKRHASPLIVIISLFQPYKPVCCAMVVAVSWRCMAWIFPAVNNDDIHAGMSCRKSPVMANENGKAY
jgi:hypothetical protein